MYSFLDRPLPCPLLRMVRRVISLSTVFAGNSRPGRLLSALACAALLVCAGAHKTQAQTTYSGGGAISITGTTVHTGNSSTLSVSGATGSVKTVFITLKGVDASGSGNNSGIGCSSFVLEGPSGQKFLLLGDTGADDTMSNATIVVEDGQGAAPLAGGDSNTDWSTTGGTVKPSSYWNGGFGWCGLIAVPSELSGVSLPQTDGSATLDGIFGSTDANGTWTLAIYTDDPGSGPDPISIAGWSLTMTFNAGVFDSTTTGVSSNITNPGLTTSSYTYTATVTNTTSPGATVDAGTVDFTENGATISGCGAKAVSGGTATCSTTFPTQGLYPIVAIYSGGTDADSNNFLASTSSAFNQLVEVATTGPTSNPAPDTWCNDGSLAVPGTAVPLAYPSVIELGNHYPANTTVANVEVELNGVTGFVDAQHLLVAPDGTHNLDFFDQGFDSAFSAPGSINLDFLDGGSSGYPDYPSGDDAPAAGSYLASDESQAVTDTFPSSSAPTYDSSIPQVPTVNYGYDPFTSNPHGPIGATFENNFSGALANGTWALYTYQPEALNETIGGGWCITLTLNPSSGAPTTTALTSSANPQVAQADVTLTAAVKASGSPVTSGGTVTFLENGTAPAGTTGGDNIVNLNTSTGQATFTTGSGPTNAVSTVVNIGNSQTKTIYEGDYPFTAGYSGSSSDDASDSTTFWQRFNDATTYSAGSGGSINACNTGPVLLDELNNKGPFEPNPSNIFVSGMPGTVNAVTLSLNGFYTSNSGAINETESLIEGPTGAALDFFSNTGDSSTQLGTTTSPLGTLTFADGNSTVPDSGNYAAGTYQPTAYGSSPDTFTSSLSGFYNVPAFTYAQPHGSGTFNTGSGADNTFGGTNPNGPGPGPGIWSLFFNTTGNVPAEGAQNGWCLNFTENPVAVMADENHSGTGTGGDFIQGETNAQITAAVSVNSASPSVSTGDPVGTNPLTLSDQLNSNLTYESFSGTDWSCSASGQTVTCTNDSAVASGSSYPTLTLNVNVSASAPTSIGNSVSVSGAGVTPTNSTPDNIAVDSSQVAPAIISGSSTTFTVGTTSSFTVTASGSPAPTFSETGSLPSGVTFATNGTLSGTPAAGTGGTYAITITASNGVAPNATQNFTLTVDQAPAITSASATTFTAGTLGSFTATATGFPAPTFSETGSLPSGVTLASNGTLSGTPAAGTGGTYAITITASNGVAPNATQNFTLTVDQAPAITSASSTTFTVGTLGSFTATATGFPTPTFSETGALPSGVTFAINGTLSGTPAAGTGGTYAITITASNGVAPNATQNFTLTVDQAPAITSASSATFTVGTAGSFTATATGFPTPTFSETGALPSGVTFAINGTLSGTPAAGPGGTYAITITASNGVAPNATQNFTLTVDQAPAITSASATTFTAGTLGSFTATATGFPTPTFSETGALPSGVTFAINGTLSGTPAAGTGGTYAITITASNGVAPNATQNFTLTVDQAPAITSASSTTFTVGTLGSFTATATGFPTPTFSETGALPSGVTFAINGTLSGTPAAGTGGTYAITITASNGVAPNATQNFTLTVDQAPAITSANNTAFIVGVPGAFTVTTTAFPAAALSLSGTLPSGIAFNDNGNGTGTLQGTAAAGTAGSYPVTITAMNGIGVNGQQSFTLTIDAVPSFVVTNTNDSGTGSLRAALSSAATAGAGSITFSPTAFSTAQTITLTTGTLNIPSYTSIAGPTSGSGASLTNLVTVAGGGSTSNFSVFTVSSGVAGAAIANLTITNGNSTIAGGGILNSGTLTVTGSAFSSDSASSGGGIRNSGTLTVTGSTFSGDSATNGGGIFNNTGSTLTVSNSTFNGNSAPGGGGGINNNGGTSTVTNSTFSGNSAAAGGGILNDGGGVLNVSNSIVAGNTATGSYADIDNASTYNNHGGNQAGTGSSGTSTIDPHLAALANYGGPTQTMLPEPGSPAICAGSYSLAQSAEISSDQRGVTFGNTGAGGYCPAGSVDAGAVQTDYAIAFVQQPTNVLTIATISPSPTVQLSESGAPISLSGADISLAATAGTLSGTTTEATGSSGLAAFAGLAIATAETNDELTATLTLNSSPSVVLTANSSQFNVELPTPSVSTVSPATGPNTGGTVVTITGTNFTGATAVSFGGVPAASFTVNSPTQILAVSPVFASAATVDITVTTSGGTSATSPADQFTYFVPIATSLTPTVTPGTTFVYANQPTISVAVSPAAATGTLTATLDTSTSLTVTPAGGGTFNIALLATPLTVGSHSIALAFTGTGVYQPSTGSISLTVTTPSLVVNTTTDDATGTASNCTSLPEGICTLRDALTAAANDGGSNNITFASSAFPAPSGATIVLSSAGTLTIPSNTTVQGLTTGSSTSLKNLVTVDGASGSNGQFSVFTVNAGTTAAIANLTIAHGTGTSVSGVANGGGIYNNSGSLTVAGSTFFGNSATSGGGGGGAIFNSGTLTVIGSTFFGNLASTFGGGAILNDDNLTVTDSTFFGNSVVSTGDGGAINSAVFLTVANSTFSGNSPSSGNNGGAITNGGPSIAVTNSIFANDTGGECDGSNCPTNGTSGNIVDSTGTHANLAPLGNYGGPTQTMIPLPGSAAICAGSSSLVPNGTTADQRGVAFNAGGYCPAGSVDAGAVQTDYAMLFTTNPPATVIPNTNFTAGVTVDEDGSPFTAVNASVGLTLNGTGTLTNSGTSPVTLTTTNGVASSSAFEVNTAGSPDALQASLTLSATATLVVLSQNFNAQGGQATHFSVTAPSTSNAGAGFHVTVTALDAGNNVAAGYTGTVHFTSTDPRAVPPSNSTLTNGSGTFTAVLETAGVQTITATDTLNSSITGTSNVVTVNPGPAESLVVSAPSTAFVGGPFNFTVTALDGLGNVATGFADPVVFASSDGAAKLPGTSTLTAGTGTFSATLMTIGDQTISATDQNQPAIAGTSGPIAVTIPAFVVNTTADDASGNANNCPANPSTTGAGNCTLRDALTAAAADGSANITFDSSVFAAANTTAENTITLGSAGTLAIPSNTTIQGLTAGTGAALVNLVTVSGNNATTVFSVNSGVTGAAIASLNITDGNTTSEAGGIYSNGALTVTRCTLSGNSAAAGGGILNDFNAALTVTGSTFTGNTAAYGGGILNNGTLTVTDSTFSSNTATGDGGGILNNNGLSQLTVTDSTVSGNFAGNGGGIGSSGTLNLANSIVAGNTATGSFADIDASTYNDNGGNQAGTSSSGTSTINPHLTTLGSYGGPTQTMIPDPGSPAICAGTATPSGGLTLPSTDQRGVAFDAGGYCSAGSVDAGAVQTDYALGFTAQPSPISPAAAIFANISFQAAVTLDESGAPFTGAAVTIPLALTSNPAGATLSGGSASTSAGVANYSTLQVSASGTNDELTANLTLNAAAIPAAAISAASSQFNVGQLTPTLSFTPSPASQAYGTAITSAALDATAAYNSANVAGSFAYTTTVNGNPVTLVAGTTVLPAGSYTITATFTPSAPTVYMGASTTAGYMVNQAPLTITASSGTMTYGGTVPTITPSYTGFVNGDSATSLTTQPTCSTTATSHSSVGNYPSSCTGAVDANYAISYSPGSVTVGHAALTITAGNAAKTYGTANPVFSGSVTGQQNGDTFTESFSTVAVVSSPVGSYTIVPSVTGADLGDYMQTIVDGTLTVTQAASITTVGLSSASITPGQSETITVTVASSTTGTPTGSVGIYDGTTLLTTVPLTGGTASYTTTALAPGLTHVISAVYSGDGNFTGSTSSSTASVTVVPLDFTMTITGPSSGTVIPGQSVSYQVTVTPLYGTYAGTVNFAIAGLPAGASATFSPSSIAANGGAQTITVTITAPPASAANHAPPRPSPTRRAVPVALAFLLLFGLGAVRRRGRAMRRLLAIVLLLAGGAAATLVSGCGGGFFAQAPQNFNVTITATASNLQHSVTVTLNVQ